MDFFKELLESFSRVKGRKLRLLEEEELDPEAVSLAKAARANAAKTRKKSLAAPIQTKSGKPLYVWTTAKGGVSFSNKEGATFPLNVDDNWSEFVAAFTAEGGGDDAPIDQTPSDSTEEVAPQLSFSQSLLQEQGIQDADLEASITTLENKLPNAIGFGGGNRSKNLIRALLKSAPTLKELDDGSFEVSDGEVNPNGINQIAETLIEIVNGSVECDQVKTTDKGNMVVYPSDFSPNGAVVFNSKDISKTVKELYSDKMKDCGKPQTISLFEEAAVRGESNIRGNLFEPVTDLFTLHTFYMENKDSMNPNAKKQLEAMMTSLYGKAKKSIGALNRTKETWMDKAIEAAVPEQEQVNYEGLAALLEGDASMLKALYRATRVSNAQRKPYLTLRVGEQVGAGKKQDSLEMWKDEESAKKAINKSFGNQKPKPKVVAVPASKIFGSKLDQYVNAGLIENGDQEFFVSEISLKTLLKGNTVVQGTTTVNATADFMQGKGKQAKFKQKFDRKAKGLMKEGTASRAAFDELVQEQEKIRDTIRDISFKNTTRGSDGKELEVNTMQLTIDSALNTLQLNSDHTSLQNNTSYKQLRKLAKTYNSIKDPKKKAKYEKDAKKALYTLAMKNSTKLKVNEMLSSKDPERRKGAMLYSAAIPFKTGASINDDTVMGIQVLEEGKSYVSTQNAAYNEIIDGITSGDPKWELDVGDSIRWNKIEDKNQSVTTSFDGETWNSKKSWSYIKGNSKEHKFDDPKLRDSTKISSLSKLQETIELLIQEVRILNAQ